jgi:anti-sigma regulatory factor (Ser/Thr protein kinase)
MMDRAMSSAGNGGLSHNKSMGQGRVERMHVASEPQCVGFVRRRLRQLLADADYSSEDASDLGIAVSEALANAIEHAGRSADRGVVNIDCAIGPHRADVTVRDYGKQPWTPRIVPPETDEDLSVISPRGRGLVSMRALTDELEIRHEGDGTAVHMVKWRHSPICG